MTSDTAVNLVACYSVLTPNHYMLINVKFFRWRLDVPKRNDAVCLV